MLEKGYSVVEYELTPAVKVAIVREVPITAYLMVTPAVQSVVYLSITGERGTYSVCFTHSSASSIFAQNGHLVFCSETGGVHGRVLSGIKRSF